MKAGLEPRRAITVTCGLAALVRAFMMFWFGGVFFFGGILALAAIASLFGLTVSQGSPLAGILIPLAMAAGGLLIVRSGRWLARDEEAFLRQFLAETIDAREAETEGERWAMRR